MPATDDPRRDRTSRGREPEGATFETVRVGGRRAAPPVAIIAFVLVLGGMIAVALGTRSGPGAAGVTGPVGLASPIASDVPSPAQTIGIPVSPLPSLGFLFLPTVTSEPGDVQLTARRAPTSIFVHGDVFVPRVTWVFVSLKDDTGNVAGWASVSVPGAAGPAMGAGPTLRFDMELAVPDAFAGRLWIDANAYDSGGSLVTSARLEVATTVRSGESSEP